MNQSKINALRFWRRKQGAGTPQIATEAKCSPASVVRIAKEEGIERRQGRRPPGATDPEIDRLRALAIDLRAQGLTIAEIARSAGRSPRSVSGALSGGLRPVAHRRIVMKIKVRSSRMGITKKGILMVADRASWTTSQENT